MPSPAFLQARVERAWADYLEQTRNLIGYRYEEAEPFAWALLQDRLARVLMLRGG